METQKAVCLTAAQQSYYWDKADEFVDDFIIRPASLTMKELRMANDQRDGLRAISQYSMVAIESGHGTGKSTMFSWAGIWYQATRTNTLSQAVKVPCIAPTHHQLMDILWPEFKKWIPLSAVSSLFNFNNESVWILGLKDLNFARARAINNPNNLQGMHAPHLLWIIDECFGIRYSDIWEMIEGSLTFVDNRIIMGGQHTTITGYCHDAFHQDRENWKCLRFDAEKSDLAKPEYSIRIAKKYGKNSDIYRVRVKGMEPRGNPESFFQLEEIEAARSRSVPGSGVLEVGLDPAGEGGDLAVATIRWGYHIYPQQHLEKSNSDQLHDMVIQMIRKYRLISGYTGVVVVKVLLTGGWGSGAYDLLLKNKEDNIKVVAVYETTRKIGLYHDVMSSMWGEFKDILPNVEIEDCPDSDYLMEELVSRRVRYENGYIRIEPKKDYKKMFDGSPDRSDSLMACITRGSVPQQVFGYYNSNNADIHRVFKIEWDECRPEEVDVFGCLWAEKDYGVYANFYFWGRKSRVLRVYSEVVQNVVVAETLAIMLSDAAVVPIGSSREDIVRVVNIWANDEVFGKVSNLAGQLRKHRIRVNRASSNNLGAVSTVNTLFREGRIVLSSDLEETDRQYRTWEIVNGKPAEGYPLCKNLCQVVGWLRENGELTEPTPLESYSKKKSKIRESLRNGGVKGVKQKTGYEWLAR